MIENDSLLTYGIDFLCEAVGWGRRDEEMTVRGLTNAVFYLLRHDKVIGCGRVIGDGGLYFYLQDIFVLPALFPEGLGKRLTRAVMAYLGKHQKRSLADGGQ
ncbi:hypothetical protein KSC_029400 [Ktedonobacter sp. SOSP1-52]|uniref:GNAT family N-acetyltransferase n=1 Tax=Ktedonobacter sp. SOSP1-52 TaxID=2778366 RepID=UPI0019158A67|nr:GNAT family N-acetyltransferase [Ktedonobacter sp. SOSP1-52]GHO64048.1 hypothetical protein KSC_029400 [Ktedonobacter sp. SOSP1-52]